MIKECLNCDKFFETYDSRVKSCSKDCARILQSTTQKQRFLEKKQLKLDFAMPGVLASLPPPEELPAPYAKRVYDMWSALIGEKENIKRIA